MYLYLVNTLAGLLIIGSMSVFQKNYFSENILTVTILPVCVFVTLFDVIWVFTPYAHFTDKIVFGILVVLIGLATCMSSCVFGKKLINL